MAMAMAMATATSSQEPISDPHFVDDFYFSALSNPDEDHELFPISDSTYALELQFQESLMSSLITPQPPPTAAATPPQSDDDGPIATAEPGQSSTSFCDICADRKNPEDMLILKPCSHSFCSQCVSSHVTTRIIRSKAAVVPCPAIDCPTALEFADIGSLLRPDVAAKWDEMLCEALIPASEKFYCPFKDCSAMMVREEGDVIRESECPVCHRLFCARCCVAWHVGIGCDEFERLNEDERGREDLMVREMAKSQSWMRCPNCKFYVEKTEGCLHLTCRCGFQFCYACGATWSQYHGGCRP